MGAWVGAVGGALIAAFAAATLLGCGRDEGSGKPQVVASTAIIADLARQVAGEDAEVRALLPPGADVHSYEPATEAARRIARADVLLVNGYRLEERLLDVIVENRRERTPVVVLAKGLAPLARAEHAEDEPGAGPQNGVDPLAFAEGDPHFWLAVPHAIRYVERIRDALAEVDAANAGGYRQRAEAYIGRLRELDAEVRAAVAQVPQSRRKLVVFHDAFGYFAREYGLQLLAAVLPSGANQQPSASDVAEIVRQVRREGVPAVYKEPQFASQVLDAIAREAGVRVLVLYSDALGGEIDGYEAMMRANARAIAEGLGAR